MAVACQRCRRRGTGVGVRCDDRAVTGRHPNGRPARLGCRRHVSLEERPWGTSITLDLEELPPNDIYVAWAVDKYGEWQHVATWGPTPNSSAHVSGASSFETASLGRIVVTPEDQSEYLFEVLNDEA